MTSTRVCRVTNLLSEVTELALRKGTCSITLAVCLEQRDRNVHVLQAHECACLQKEKQPEPAKIMRWSKPKESFELSSRLLSIIPNYTSLHLPKQSWPSQHWQTHCFIGYSRMFAGKHVNNIPLALGSGGFLTLLHRIDTGWKDYAVLQLPHKSVVKNYFNFCLSARDSPEHLCLEFLYTLFLISPHRHLLPLNLCW